MALVWLRVARQVSKAPQGGGPGLSEPEQRRRAGQGVGPPGGLMPPSPECESGGFQRGAGLDGTKHLVALHQAALGARGQAECGGGQTVDVAHLSLGGLMEKGQGVGGK